MENTSTYFKYQYDLILGARASLLNYCATISNEDFLNQKSAFGLGGSIRNLLVHIANTYQLCIPVMFPQDSGHIPPKLRVCFKLGLTKLLLFS